MGIAVEHIRKSYGRKQVLTDITFSANEGECVGILGGNGCGKSTLLGILAGVNRARGGRFIYNDTDLLHEANRRAEAVGYVPQGTPLIEELTARDNLRLWYNAEDIETSLKSGVLAMLGINEFLRTEVRKMSGGMKKRLAIGCSVAHSPKILIMDEPSAALDLTCKERIANYLKDFRAGGGITVLATHDVSEIELCDRLFIMRGGILEPFVYDGNVHKLAGRLGKA